MTHAIGTAQVGQTTLSVANLGLGAAPLGDIWRPIPESQAIETVHYALQHGVTFIDTAPYYGDGLSETRLGLALRGVPRDSYTLATKVGRVIRPGGGTEFDWSRDGVLRSFESSLKRLQLDHVDILHLHDPDEGTYRQAIEEAYPTLAELRAQGVIKAVGAGMNWIDLQLRFAQEGQFDCFLLAGRYTLIEQGVLAGLETFRQRGISVFGAGVYNSGILAGGSKSGAWYQYGAPPPAVIAKVEQLEALCARFNVPLRAAAVQFVKAHPAMTALIIGAESAAQLAETLHAYTAPIPPEFWLALRRSGLIDPASPLPGGSQ